MAKPHDELVTISVLDITGKDVSRGGAASVDGASDFDTECFRTAPVGRITSGGLGVGTFLAGCYRPFSARSA